MFGDLFVSAVSTSTLCHTAVSDRRHTKLIRYREQSLWANNSHETPRHRHSDHQTPHQIKCTEHAELIKHAQNTVDTHNSADTQNTGTLWTHR